MLAGVLWPPGWGWPACDATTAGTSQQGEVGTHLSRALGDAILADDPGACVVQLQMATQAARQRVDAALTSLQSNPLFNSHPNPLFRLQPGQAVACPEAMNELRSAIAAERDNVGERERAAGLRFRELGGRLEALRAQERRRDRGEFNSVEIKQMAVVTLAGLRAFLSNDLPSKQQRTLDGIADYTHNDFVRSIGSHCPLLVRLSFTDFFTCTRASVVKAGRDPDTHSSETGRSLGGGDFVGGATTASGRRW